MAWRGLAAERGVSELAWDFFSRMAVAAESNWALVRMKVAAKVSGHSVRGRPVVHAGGWVDGERPLLSFNTAGLAGHDEYTFLLSNRPVFE